MDFYSAIIVYRQKCSAVIFKRILLIFQDESLWACLAAMAAYHKQLATAEVAYAAIDEVHIQTSRNSLDRNAF